MEAKVNLLVKTTIPDQVKIVGGLKAELDKKKSDYQIDKTNLVSEEVNLKKLKLNAETKLKDRT